MLIIIYLKLFLKTGGKFTAHYVLFSTIKTKSLTVPNINKKCTRLTYNSFCEIMIEKNVNLAYY